MFIIGVYYNWPKFKYQLLSGTGWFSYKIWTKNSKTPIVNLFKNLRPFQNYIFKIQWEIHFLTFFKYWPKLFKKKFQLKYGHSHFKSAFGINFGLREVVKLKIHVYAYTCIFSLTASRCPKLIAKAELKWECPYFNSKFFFQRVLANILKSKKMDFPLYFKNVFSKWPKVF